MKTSILIILLSVFTFEGIQSKMEDNQNRDDKKERVVLDNKVVDIMQNLEQDDAYIYGDKIQQSKKEGSIRQDTASNQQKPYVNGTFQCKGVNIILSYQL